MCLIVARPAKIRGVVVNRGVDIIHEAIDFAERLHSAAPFALAAVFAGVHVFALRLEV